MSVPVKGIRKSLFVCVFSLLLALPVPLYGLDSAEQDYIDISTASLIANYQGQHQGVSMHSLWERLSGEYSTQQIDRYASLSVAIASDPARQRRLLEQVCRELKRRGFAGEIVPGESGYDIVIDKVQGSSDKTVK